MNRRIAYLVIFGMFFMVIVSVSADSNKESAALKEAHQWLAFVDAKNYAKSWDRAAELFKNAVQVNQWEQLMQAVREPLGGLVSRTLNATTFQASLPGAPDGEYVVIQFDTSFENKKAAVETVTPMLDKDGNWRVSGYYIK